MTGRGQGAQEAYQWEAKAQWKGKPLEGDVALLITLYFGTKRRAGRQLQQAIARWPTTRRGRGLRLVWQNCKYKGLPCAGVCRRHGPHHFSPNMNGCSLITLGTSSRFHR